MDHGHFDELARSVASGVGTRRAVLRLLAGSALTAVAARLGLAEGAVAKGKKRQKAKSKQQRKPRAERKAQGQLRAEGKGSGKGKKHGKKPKPPRPPCAAGQKRCPDGSCIPDQPYTCCLGQRDCGDEGCYPASKCCPSQTKCPDGSCRHLERYECCPGQQSCGDEGCVPEDQCCLHERKCGDGTCIREGPPDYECCPNERECGDEGCFPEDRCCPSQIKCPDGSCLQLNADECCPGQHSCGAYQCVAEDACCPDALPSCGNCFDAYCAQGTWSCRANPASCVCPAGGVPCPLVSDPGYGLPDGCCAADRIFPDEWYGTGNAYCRPEYDWQGYWCTMDGFPGT